MSKIVTPEMKAMLRAVASEDPVISRAAGMEVAVAIKTPLRQGIMAGDITDGIFERVHFDYGIAVEFPLDFLAPGTEKDYVAFTVPAQGRPAQREVEGDYVTCPTFPIKNTISCGMDYARDARWDVVGRMRSVLEAGHIKKKNDDAFHLLIGAGADRNIVVYDSNANSGQFTKRVLSVGKTIMRRNGGGNSSSVNRGKLTDVYLSPELIEDMRNWGIDLIDEVSRREIYVADDNSPTFMRVFGVNLHDIDELGESQEYQNYFTNDLGGSLPAGDLELMIGLDLSPGNNDSFMNPYRADITVKPNPMLEYEDRFGFVSSENYGYCALDERRVILLSA